MGNSSSGLFIIKCPKCRNVWNLKLEDVWIYFVIPLWLLIPFKVNESICKRCQKEEELKKEEERKKDEQREKRREEERQRKREAERREDERRAEERRKERERIIETQRREQEKREQERRRELERWRAAERARRRAEEMRERERRKEEERRQWEKREEEKRRENEKRRAVEKERRLKEWREMEKRKEEERKREREKIAKEKAEEQRKERERIANEMQKKKEREEEWEKRSKEWRTKKEKEKKEEEWEKRSEEWRKKKEEEKKEEEWERRSEEWRKKKEEEERENEWERRAEAWRKKKEEEEREEEWARRKKAEEEREKEWERRAEEWRKKKDKEEQEEEESERRKIEANQRVEESIQKVQEFREQHWSSGEAEVKKHVVLSLHTSQPSGEDHLLGLLSSSCGVKTLCVSQLTADELRLILLGLDNILFGPWTESPPPLATLQEAQVFLTEVCTLFLEVPDGTSLEVMSERMHGAVDFISQSADGIADSLLLAKALYLNLTEAPNERGQPCDAVSVARHWLSDSDVSVEQLCLLEFLSNLLMSLQRVAEEDSFTIQTVEVQCLKVLLAKLSELQNENEEARCRITKKLLRLVVSNGWTPTQALSLLRELSIRYKDEEKVICKVLTLANLHNIPEWSEDRGQSLLQALDTAGPHPSCPDLLQSVGRVTTDGLTAAVAEYRMSGSFDSILLKKMESTVARVMQQLVEEPDGALDRKNSFKGATNTEDLLFDICTAVSLSKGFWPTAGQMLRWCELVLLLPQKSIELHVADDDQCVATMFAAKLVQSQQRLDVVLNSNTAVNEHLREWSDFYQQLGISVCSSSKQGTASHGVVSGVDIVFGTMENFLSRYLQQYLEDTAEARTVSPVSRKFFVEKQVMTSIHRLEFSELDSNEFLTFTRDVLQGLMHQFHGEAVELMPLFMKTLLKVLQTKPNQEQSNKFIHILQKICETSLSSSQVFSLNFLESLLKALSEASEIEENKTSLAAGWCSQVLFDCLERFQASKEERKELFWILSELGTQRLWSPADALSLLQALTEYHHDKGCVSIKKILHLLLTYQVSSKWKDENEKSLLQLTCSLQTKKLIQYIERILRDEKGRTTESLLGEIYQTRDVDEQTLYKINEIVTYVKILIESGRIKNFQHSGRARNLSHSTDTKDLQELLALLCHAVYVHRTKKKWWPRATQMISWCLLALSDSGKLLEMHTGEGKSCVIAMFAALRVLRGETVEIVSSSSILCQRDAEEWSNFYKHFGITVDSNTDQDNDENRRECYSKDIVYGSIEAFAADHLRQIFEMKNVMPNRSPQCILIDEVDSLLLDQGVQQTYLSSPVVSMQHLNTILAMIWAHVSQYGCLSTKHQTFVHTQGAPFFRIIFDSIDTDDTPIKDPLDILRIAEETGTVPKGFSEDLSRSGKDDLVSKLKSVSQESVEKFLMAMEEYVPYTFSIYRLDESGFLCLQRRSTNKDVPEVAVLVLEDGLCCTLYDSEDTLIRPIAQLISEKLQYTPCPNIEGKICIPGFLESLVQKKVSVWVQNAFLAIQLREGREYVIEKGNICPVDFRSTGIVELNKKWGDGLQQFVELKHQLKLSTISVVTNYISNISFFHKYHGKIYGTTGTLGSKTDILFLQKLYPSLSFCKIPPFNRKKLFEVKGTLGTSAEEWKAEIKGIILNQIRPNSYRGGRAALVICETINEAKDIQAELEGSVPPEKIISYCRSDSNSLSKIDQELCPGDVIVATNLAGRGTDIKVSQEVNRNGGLFVVVSFLSENTRVELQAFGRTARKGEPGSAQVIMSTSHMHPCYRAASSLAEAKSIRNKLAEEKVANMMSDVTELKLREDLFLKYLETLQDIYHCAGGDERSAVVATMNEFWGMWLLTKSEEIEQLKRKELQESLEVDLLKAKRQTQSHTSPCASIYHYIKFGNIALTEKQWNVAIRLFEKAMILDESWAAIAFYSHAFCTMQEKKPKYLTVAKDDLTKALESLKFLSAEAVTCLQLAKMSSANSANTDLTSLEKQLTNKCTILNYYDKNICEAIERLNDISERGREAVAKRSSIFSLVASADDDLQMEAFNLYCQGLKYIFSVEEEPRFCWEGLAVFMFGVLQIVGGALLITFTYGTFAHIGMELISEGISDCITGIEAMVRGEFSWKSWAIQKAVSIAVSIVAFGVGKLVAKGYKGCKMSIQGVGKELKAMPAFLSKQAKEGLSVVAKTNMKNALKVTGKKLIEEVASYGLRQAEEKMLEEILDKIKTKVKTEITSSVKSSLHKKSMATLVENIILSHVEDQKQLQDLLVDKASRSQLLDLFTRVGNVAMQPFYSNLGWQNRFSSSLLTVLRKATAEAKGTAATILKAIQVGHVSVLATDATVSALKLSGEFMTNFEEEMSKLKKRSDKAKELTPSDTEMLNGFRMELGDNISAILADALVQVFHQKFSSHVVSHVQGKINGFINGYVRAGLKSDRTEEKLRAGQNNRYISHMQSKGRTSVNNPSRNSGVLSLLHAERIEDPSVPGTIFEARVLSEMGGFHMVIMTEDSNGKLIKMQELNPEKKSATKTVTLVYRPKSAQYPDGHYDVQIDNRTVTVVSEEKSCMFHAIAQGLHPRASEDHVIREARNLRVLVAEGLIAHANKWESFAKRKIQTEAIRGGDRFMLEAGAGKKMRESRKVLKEEVGKIKVYKQHKKDLKKNSGLGQFIQGDHQPALSSILEVSPHESTLAQAMLEVATNSSPLNNNQINNVKKSHGPNLPVVCVPKEVHYEFLSTKSKGYRDLVAASIRNGDVESTLKYMVLGGMPRCMLKPDDNNVKDFQNSNKSKARLKTFRESFPEHSQKMVETWYYHLQSRDAMTKENLANVTSWLNSESYNNQNDPYWKEVSKHI